MRLTAVDLEARIHARRPHALVVEERLIRRAVREHRGIIGVRSFVPHTHVYAIPRAVLLAAVPPEELGAPLPPDADWLILVPRVDDVDDSDAVLLETWRHLFHASIDEALGRQIDDGRLSRTRILEVFDRIGQIPMDEARAVLQDEGLTGGGASETRDLVELIALYNDLRFFDPALLDRYFPSLIGRGDLVATFDALVPSAELFLATRLEGAPDPSARATARDAARAAHDDDDRPLPRWRVRGLLDAARRAIRHARDVDAAVAAWRASQIAPRGSAEQIEADAHQAQALESLGRRLCKITQAEGADEWPAALEPLLPRARWGMARAEARLLHDLERACDDSEHGVWDIDLGRWLRRLGRAPLRREEVVRQKVAVARHLARALRRLVLVRVPEADRRRLERLLGALAHHVENRVRDEVGGVLAEGLRQARLVPENLPERVAEQKIVAELCDKLLERGFIAFADVRDLVARNQLKLEDLGGAREWLGGDQLLALDRYCAQHLDAAYRRAEFYRRAFQRMSSLLFGTVIGRLLVRFALLPLLGAFVIVEGFDHTVMAIVRWIFGGHTHISSIPLLIATTVFLFAVLHSERMRRWTVRALRAVGRGVSFVFSGLPDMIRDLPWVARLLRTRAWERFREHVWRPAQYAIVPTLITVLATKDARMWLWVGLPLVVAISIWFATRRGRRFAESSRDWLVVASHHLRHELVPGLVSAVMAFFKAVVDKVEVVLYVVDQWLRYRRGDSRVGLVIKAVFGFSWSIVAYMVRLTVSLVAEPQLNPIKHFPVVTVAHKVTLPASGFVAKQLSESMGPAWGNFLGLGVFQLTVPGICGFLVWEFKENWRLYKANRLEHLRPAIVGSHGEPVHRLLRPGFHSGTVPTLFRKLRRAERRGRMREVRRFSDELHHVEEAVERFVLRELRAVLVLSGRFPEAEHLAVAQVRLTPARIAIDITCTAFDAPPLELAFEEQSRFLVAHVAKPGFVVALDDARRAALDMALLGLYKLASVDLVREHLAGLFPGRTRYDIGPRGLVVWPTVDGPDGPARAPDFTTEVVYPLRLDYALIEPHVRGPRPEQLPPPIRVADIAFKQRLVAWRDWIAAWSDTPASGPRVEAADALSGRSLLVPAAAPAG